MQDLRRYLLRNWEAIDAFRDSFGDKFYSVLDGIDTWISSRPSGVWIDYTRNLSPEKIPRMVGMLCCWMLFRVTDSCTIDFSHPYADHIKIRRYEFKTFKQDNSRNRNGQKKES